MTRRFRQAWNIWEGEGVFARGAAEVATAPVIELGQALIELLSGTLPDDPPDNRWIYGTPRGRDLLRRQ